MYNYGLVTFMRTKKLKSNQSINAYLVHKGVSDFNAKNYNRVNDFLEKNWSNFAQFIDKSLKDGSISGERVRLNYHFEEQKNRYLKVNSEFEKENLSKDEQWLLNLETYFSKTHSFLAKKGLKIPQKNLDYISAKLRNMPIILVLRENDLVSECVSYVKDFLPK